MIKNDHFKAFPQLNDLESKSWLNSTTSINLTMTDLHFTSDSLTDKIMRTLAEEKLLPIKEVLECFEYFHRIRKKAKAPIMADLCCGHGLLGILFAIFERKVERIYLVDKNEPPSRKKVIATLTKITPWIQDKIVNKAEKLTPESPWLEEGMAIISAHACGTLSDLCIDIALKTKGPLAILPCCYPKNSCQAPNSLQQQFGFETAFDIDRTYLLEKNLFKTKWLYIPNEISPMNRIILATP